MINVTKATEQYINTHPTAKQAIKMNIVNYSKLARRISEETGIASKDAIVIACRRFYRKLRASKEPAEVMGLLRGTKLSIRDKILVVILEPDVRFESVLSLQKEIEKRNETVHVMRGANAITLIVTEDFLAMIKRIFGISILKVSSGLVEIMMKSPARLEEVRGVMAYIYSLFGENDVNIIETISCWTDTILVIRKEDLSKTMGFLNF